LRNYLKTMEYELKERLKDKEFNILSYYGDKKPHRLYQQFFWLKAAYKDIESMEFTEIVKKFLEYSLLEPFGKDYTITKFIDREHILTEKGDRILREVMINRGEDSNIRIHQRK